MLLLLHHLQEVRASASELAAVGQEEWHVCSVPSPLSASSLSYSRGKYGGLSFPAPVAVAAAVYAARSAYVQIPGPAHLYAAASSAGSLAATCASNVSV